MLKEIHVYLTSIFMQFETHDIENVSKLTYTIMRCWQIQQLKKSLCS